jgi:flagellar protein FlaI
LKRLTVLAYLLREDLNEYAQVAATIQAFITDPESVLRMVADETLEENLQNLRTMESVSIDIDQDDEEMVPRPTADGELRDEVDEVMEEAKEKIFSDMDGIDMSSTKSLKDVLSGSNSDEDLTIEPDDTDENDDSGGFLSDDTGDDDGDVPDFLKGSDSGSDSEVDDEEVLDLFGDDDSDSSDDLLGDTTGSESDSSPQDDIFDGDDSTDGTSSDSTDSDSEGSVFNAGGKEDPLEFDDDTVSDGEDDDVVHGSPAENTAGADSAAAVEQEEKRRKFAGMEDKNDSSWVFEDDSDELFVGDAFDDDGDDDDDGDEEGDGEGDGEGDDGDWVDMGDD